MIERATAARRAGLDSLFVGDHHATAGPYYQNVPILGRLLAEWGDAPAGCLFLLPLWNPVLVAEQVGTLAAIARGRFILQCGLGTDEAQFRAMGAELRYRPSAFEESLGIVRRLLAGETVSSSGRFVFSGARLALRPSEPVDVWIGATAEPAIDRAARLGDGWLAAPGITPEEARTQAAYYHARCQTHGANPHGRRHPAGHLRRRVTADVEATAGPILARGHRGFNRAALIAGTVDEVADTLPRARRHGLHRRHRAPSHRRPSQSPGLARPPGPGAQSGTGRLEARAGFRRGAPNAGGTWGPCRGPPCSRKPRSTSAR